MQPGVNCDSSVTSRPTVGSCVARRKEFANTAQWKLPTLNFITLMVRTNSGHHGKKSVEHEWILDTRDTVHMTHWREYFNLMPGQQVTACNGEELQIEGIGDILVQGSAGDMHKPLLIRNVLLAPELTNNLLSGVC